MTIRACQGALVPERYSLRTTPRRANSLQLQPPQDNIEALRRPYQLEKCIGGHVMIELYKEDMMIMLAIYSALDFPVASVWFC